MRDNADGITKLLNFLEVDKTSEQERLQNFYLGKKGIRLGMSAMILVENWVARALRSFYVEKNLSHAKQDFYVASKLKIFGLSHDGGRSLGTPLPLLCALLSDSKDAIAALTSPEVQEVLVNRHDHRCGEFNTHMLQLAIRGDDDALRLKIEKLAMRGSKRMRNDASKGIDFFSLLLHADKPALESLIQEKHVRIKENDTLLENFMAYTATFETKLCWLRGLKVQIDSPLVPMEFMPIDPLPIYDPVHDFLRPGWEPPKPTLWKSISGIVIP
jgi:hypothetical protein